MRRSASFFSILASTFRNRLALEAAELVRSYIAETEPMLSMMSVVMTMCAVRSLTVRSILELCAG